MQVELNEFRRQWREIERDAVGAFTRVGASGWYILGAEVRRFEGALASAWPIEHAVGVASGLDAIEIALRSLGIASGDRVLTTPLSAFATSLAVIRAGAVPVFVDVDERGLADLERCRELLRRDPGIRWFLPVHLYGQLVDLHALRGLREEFELRLIEDCAQSIGATWAGIAGGTVGEVAATSFYPTKNLGALGDGGAVLTASAAIAEKASALRHYGQSATYVHDHIGMNSRLDELHAAVMADAMLPRVAAWTERRRAIALRYRAGIANANLTLPHVPAESSPAWHLFPVLVRPALRDAFVAHLRAQDVMTGVHYPTLIPAQRAMQEHGRFEVVGELENAVRFAAGEVSLPIHPFLTDAEADRVVGACNSWNGR